MWRSPALAAVLRLEDSHERASVVSNPIYQIWLYVELQGFPVWWRTACAQIVCAYTLLCELLHACMSMHTYRYLHAKLCRKVYTCSCACSAGWCKSHFFVANQSSMMRQLVVSTSVQALVIITPWQPYAFVDFTNLMDVLPFFHFGKTLKHC